MHFETDRAWIEKRCADVRSFEELGVLALSELVKFRDGAEIVCGPITTGGYGNVSDNLKAFGATILHLRSRGRPVFNQMPYEEKIFALTRAWKSANPLIADNYHEAVLGPVYGRLFRSGRIRKGIFLPGWDTSKGARWERRLLSELGIETSDFSEDIFSSVGC